MDYTVAAVRQWSDNAKQLGRTRRVQINEFKGKQLVDIREFYEKEGDMLPGKKVSHPKPRVKGELFLVAKAAEY